MDLLAVVPGVVDDLPVAVPVPVPVPVAADAAAGVPEPPAVVVTEVTAVVTVLIPAEAEEPRTCEPTTLAAAGRLVPPCWFSTLAASALVAAATVALLPV